MKRLLGLVIAFSGLSAQAQTGKYTINGKLGNYNSPAKVYFYHASAEGAKTDSSILKEGNFQFLGTVKDPFSGVLLVDFKGIGFERLSREAKADALNIYVEKGEINIRSADSISEAKITGSTLNDDNQKLRAKLKPIQNKIAALNNEYQSAPEDKKSSPDFRASLQSHGDAIQKEQKEILKSFIRENPASYVSLDAIGAFTGGGQPNFAEIEPLYNLLSGKLKQTVAGKALGAAILEGKKNAIGSLAADFSQENVDGKVIKLSDYRGKYLLLDFWASWCGPCRQENPNVVQAYQKYKNKNFEILGISLDRESGKSAWLRAIKDDGLAWTQVSDLKGWQNEAAVLYGVQGIPQNFLLDPQGRIIAKNLRGEELDRKLAELIK